MKKFITLLCAVALTIGASATLPTKQLVVKKQAKDATFAQSTKATRNAVAEDPSDTINLQILDYSNMYYSTSNDVFYVLNCSDQFQFRFDIYVDSTDVESGVEYTLLEMESDYSWGVDTAAWKQITYDDAWFKKVDDEKAITIDAKVWEGDTLYILSYYFAKPAIAKYDTIVVTDLEFDARDFDAYIEEYGLGVFTASSMKGEISLAFQGPTEIEGTYNQSIVSGKIKGADVFSCLVTVAEDGDNYTVVGDLLTLDSIQYHIDMSYVLPEASRKDTIELENGIIQDAIADNGLWQGMWGDSDIVVMLTFRAEELEDEYDTEDIYARSYNFIIQAKGADTLTYFMHTANIKVELQADEETYMVTGTLVGVNAEGTEAVEFTISLAAVVKNYIQYDEQTYAWSYNFTNGEIDDQYATSYGVILVSGENATYSASVNLEFVGEEAPAAGVYDISSEGEDGTFSAGNLDEGYLVGSYVVTSDYSHIWFLVSGTVTVNADGSMTIDAVNSYDIPVTGTIYMAQTPVDNVDAENVKANKVIRNGQLILKSNNREFNALGQEL